MSEIIITSENFEEEVVKSDVPVLVDFWAEWCGPCKMVGPVIAEIAENADGKFKVGKINVDDEMELAQKYKVASIPSIYLLKNGELVDGLVGFSPKPKIMAMIEKHL